MASVSRLDIAIAWLAEQPFVLCGIVAAVLVLAAVLMRQTGDPATGTQRRINSVALFVLAGLVLAIGTAMFAVETDQWGYLLALLPGAAIGRHAAYMRVVRRRALAAPIAPPAGLQRRLNPDEDVLEMREAGLSLVFARARQMHDLDFAPETLALRFGVPALLATAIGIGVFDLLKDKAHLGLLASSAAEVVRAARFGAVGAMVYVLLYLGQRGFRNDITTGSALWSAIVLAAGPLIAAVLGLAWKGSPDSTWTRDALYFVAGMSPRHAASAVEEAVRRLWLSRGPAPDVPSRLQPLGLLRGMTTPIEDRLAEEGIADVQGMAMADPLRLFRTTSFDKRQILSWIDEALLITWLPDLYSAVQKVGITGAIDLMAHAGQRKEGLQTVLKNAAKMEPATVDAVVLTGVLLREDAQLRLVWALYQFDEDGFDIPAPAPTSETLAQLAVPTDAPPAAVIVPAWGWLLAGLLCLLASALLDKQRVSVSSLVAPLAVLAIAFAVAVTARWPWPHGQARAIPATAVSVLLVVGYLGRAKLADALTWQWPTQQLFLTAAAACASVFAAAFLADRIGCALTIAFPNGAPADAELWVNGHAVSIARDPTTETTATTTTTATVCTIPRRRLTIVARSGTFHQQRWLDARACRTSSLSLPLPATLVLQLDPPATVPLRRLVDGVEVDNGPLMLWPRKVPYSVVVEAEGLRGAATVSVLQAELIAQPILLEPHPRPPGVVFVDAGRKTATPPGGGDPTPPPDSPTQPSTEGEGPKPA